MGKPFYISEDSFRVALGSVDFQFEKSEAEEEAHDSRKIRGIMSTQRRDRQGETLTARGLSFNEFLHNGHFNDNHSQETSAIVGYPTKVQFHESLEAFGVKAPGWTCEGYVLKGTKRADAIWELAKALRDVPDRKLGFSVEGKVTRREDKTIKEAHIRNVAITNCPVNTDCTWDVLEKSFHESDLAIKSMVAGYGTSPGTQSGGGALRGESLESDLKKLGEKRAKKVKALLKALEFEDLMKAMELIMENRENYDEEAAAVAVKHLLLGGKL